MPLVSSKEILTKAQKGQYGVGAFNFVNLETLKAILNAAQKCNSPVILGVSEGAIKYAGLNHIVAMAKAASRDYTIPFALHLDHGSSYDICKQVIEAGFTSVMIDASHLSYEENINEVNRVVEFAKKYNVPVEAELGRLAGTEDHVSVSGDQAFYTDPHEAKDFVTRSGCDFLAVSVGTSHGAYKTVAAAGLAQNRIQQIKKFLPNTPLVLHGASSIDAAVVTDINRYGGELKETAGTRESDIQTAITNGICKINVDSDMRLAFTAAVRKTLNEKKSEFDIRKILTPAMDAISAVVEYKIKNVFKSENKA